MASLVQDLSCPICLHIYNDPVILTCSHSFCTTCLQEFWETKTVRQCPVCERRCSKSDDFVPNLALKNLCDAFSKDGDEDIYSAPAAGPKVHCSQHKKKLRLFCHEDQTPLCLLCRDSKLHKGHNFSLIEEVVVDRKVGYSGHFNTMALRLMGYILIN